MGRKRLLPGKELLLRKLVATAGFLKTDLAAAHGGHDSGFTADYPSLGVRRRQLNHRRCSDQQP
jgi:hypothetical protein